METATTPRPLRDRKRRTASAESSFASLTTTAPAHAGSNAPLASLDEWVRRFEK